MFDDLMVIFALPSFYFLFHYFQFRHLQIKMPVEAGKNTKLMTVIRFHKGVPVICRRDKGFLDRSRTDPSQQVKVKPSVEDSNSSRLYHWFRFVAIRRKVVARQLLRLVYH